MCLERFPQWHDLFFWWLVMLSIFSMYLMTTCVSLEKMSVQILCPFSNWVGCFFFFLLLSSLSLCILGINTLSDVWSANIFSHWLDYLFILLMFLLLCRNFWVWCLSCLFLLLLPLLLMLNLKNCQNECHRAHCLCFLPRFLWFQVLDSGL